MKLFLEVTLCFAFASAVIGQGYGRTRPIARRPTHTRGRFDPFEGNFDNGLDALRGGGHGPLPDHVRRVLGRTISGSAIVGGMDGFPRHGGTLNVDGLVNGWGADQSVPVDPAVDMWSDPLNGAAFPTNYNGEELIFDPSLNRHVVRKGGSVGHQIAKESHVGAKTGGIISGGGPFGPVVDPKGHNVVKSTGTINAGHVGIDHPSVIAHNIRTATLGADAVAGHNRARAAGSPVGIGFINPNGHIAAQSGHNMIGADPFGVDIDPFGQVSHGAIKTSSGRHIGVSRIGTINAGHVGIDAPGVIAHNIGKSTLGSDAMVGHDIAKNSGSPVGIGFINPGNPVNSHGGHAAAGPLSIFGEDVAKVRAGIGMPHGRILNRASNPVHNVNKAGHTGLAGIGHDPLAATIGHGIAKHSIGEAATAVDIGSRGGVSAGDPFAVAATNGLARESLHVADKTLGIASGMGTGRRFNAGMGIFGEGPMIQPKPVIKPIPKLPTGYGRRRI